MSSSKRKIDAWYSHASIPSEYDDKFLSRYALAKSRVDNEWQESPPILKYEFKRSNRNFSGPYRFAEGSFGMKKKKYFLGMPSIKDITATNADNSQIEAYINSEDILISQSTGSLITTSIEYTALDGHDITPKMTYINYNTKRHYILPGEYEASDQSGNILVAKRVNIKYTIEDTDKIKERRWLTVDHPTDQLVLDYDCGRIETWNTPPEFKIEHVYDFDEATLAREEELWTPDYTGPAEITATSTLFLAMRAEYLSENATQYRYKTTAQSIQTKDGVDLKTQSNIVTQNIDKLDPSLQYIYVLYSITIEGQTILRTMLISSAHVNIPAEIPINIRSMPVVPIMKNTQAYTLRPGSEVSDIRKMIELYGRDYKDIDGFTTGDFYSNAIDGYNKLIAKKENTRDAYITAHNPTPAEIDKMNANIQEIKDKRDDLVALQAGDDGPNYIKELEDSTLWVGVNPLIPYSYFEEFRSKYLYHMFNTLEDVLSHHGTGNKDRGFTVKEEDFNTRYTYSIERTNVNGKYTAGEDYERKIKLGDGTYDIIRGRVMRNGAYYHRTEEVVISADKKKYILHIYNQHKTNYTYIKIYDMKTEIKIEKQGMLVNKIAFFGEMMDGVDEYDPISGKVLLPIFIESGIKLGSIDRANLIRTSVTITGYSAKITIIKWYQRGIFQILLFILIVIISIYFGPETLDLMTIINTLAVTMIRAFVIKIIAKVLEIFGIEIAVLLLIIYALYTGDFSDVLDMSNSIMDNYFQGEISDLQKEAERMEAIQDENYHKIKEFRDEVTKFKKEHLSGLNTQELLEVQSDYKQEDDGIIQLQIYSPDTFFFAKLGNVMYEQATITTDVEHMKSTKSLQIQTIK